MDRDPARLSPGPLRSYNSLLLTVSTLCLLFRGLQHPVCEAEEAELCSDTSKHSPLLLAAPSLPSHLGCPLFEDRLMLLGGPQPPELTRGV